MKILLYTLNADLSPKFFALDLARTLQELGHEAEVVYTTDHWGGEYVVNLRETRNVQLLQSQRFLGAKAIAMNLTGNVEDLGADGSLVTTLYHLRKNRHSGAAIRLFAISPYQHQQIKTLVRRTFAPALGRTILTNVEASRWGVSSAVTWGTENDPDNWIVPANRIDPTDKQKCLVAHQQTTQKIGTLLANAKAPIQRHDFFVNDDAHTAKVTKPKITRQQAEQTYAVLPQRTDREEYFDGLHAYGMALCTSKFESFGLYYLELLKSGVVVVFESYKWVQDLLPGYPFIASREDLAPMAVAVRLNHEDARRQVRDYLTAAEGGYELKSHAQRILTFFESTAT
jgi:hypothetical protein